MLRAYCPVNLTVRPKSSLLRRPRIGCYFEACLSDCRDALVAADRLVQMLASLRSCQDGSALILSDLPVHPNGRIVFDLGKYLVNRAETVRVNAFRPLTV